MLPGGHSLHTVCPVAAANEPAGHKAQVPGALPRVPAGHASQPQVTPRGPRRLPNGHVNPPVPTTSYGHTQVVRSAPTVVRPSGHGAQSLAPSAEMLPVAHVSHVNAPGKAVYVPATHGRHAGCNVEFGSLRRPAAATVPSLLPLPAPLLFTSAPCTAVVGPPTAA